MTVLSIDIETYSDYNLSDVGVYKYVDSPNFKILLFAYAINDGDVQVVDLEHGEDIPKDIEIMLFNPEIVKSAFNAQFERVCLNKHFKEDTVNWECTMIKAWSCGINGGLASVGDAIGLSEDNQKMKEGKALINKYCTLNGNKNNDFSDWEVFKEYCKRDVEVEQNVRKKLEKFKTLDKEIDLYKLDQEINDNGIRLDLDMVKNAIKIDNDLAERSQKRYKEITGLENPNSLKDIKEFIKLRTGKTVKSITKSNNKELQEEFKDFPEVVEVLQIRQLLSKTSTAKYKMMEEVAMKDHRSRGNIQFYGAQRTGRWAGRLIQVHNLPQNHISDLDTARKIVKYGDYDLLAMTYDNPPDILSQCLRTAIVPEKGFKFIVSDFSAIEARVIAWFADEDWRLEAFRNGQDIYCTSASQMFGVPVEKHGVNSNLRQKGKVAELACGYQGGMGALKSMGGTAMGLSDDEMKDIVVSWRKASPNIVNFWKEAELSVKEAIENTTSVVFANGKLRTFYQSGILWIELPSGRRLAYARPRIEPHEKWQGEQIVFFDRNSAGTDWIKRVTYGGMLVENIVQATARDCLAHSMLRLKEEGYKIVMHVHDEVVIEIEEEKEELQRVTDIMSEEIEWAIGLPLTADGYECKYYQKD